MPPKASLYLSAGRAYTGDPPNNPLQPSRCPCGIEGFWDYNCALRSVQNRHRARPNGCKNDDEKNRFIFDISFMDQPQAGFQYRSMIPEKVSFFIGRRIL